MWCLTKWRHFGGAPVNDVIVTACDTSRDSKLSQSVYKGSNILWSKFHWCSVRGSWNIKGAQSVPPPPLKVILEYVHMRPKVKSNWSEFTSVHGVFFICVHMNFILLWVVFHFSEIDRSEVFKPVWDCMWTHFYLKWIFYPKWNETLKKFTRPI